MPIKHNLLGGSKNREFCSLGLLIRYVHLCSYAVPRSK